MKQLNRKKQIIVVFYFSLVVLMIGYVETRSEAWAIEPSSSNAKIPDIKVTRQQVEDTLNTVKGAIAVDNSATLPKKYTIDHDLGDLKYKRKKKRKPANSHLKVKLVEEDPTSADFDSLDNEIESDKYFLKIKDHAATEVDDITMYLEDASKAYKLGQLEIASQIYQKVNKIDPSNQQALFGMASISHLSGQYEEARSIYALLLQKDPTNYQALNNFLAIIGEEDPNEAIAELRKLESINSELSIIPAQIAMLYAKIKEYDRAIKHFQRALSLDPQNTLYTYNLGIVYEKSDNRELAIKTYKKLLDSYYNGVALPESASKINKRLAFLSLKLETKQ